MFRIPLPCKLGETIEYKGKTQILTGVSFFNWTNYGWEFTYVFDNGRSILEDKDFDILPCFMEINDVLLTKKTFKDVDFPLTGAGKLHGIKYINGKLYAEVIVTSRYLEHLLVECDENGNYNGGVVIFPPTPSYDSIEKQAKAVTAQYARENILKPELASAN